MQLNKRGGSAVLDDFYTNVDLARRLIGDVERVMDRPLGSWKLVVEPSAGGGAFFNNLPPWNRRGYDISPKCDGVRAADFFHVVDECFTEPLQDTLVIGNPPFGKNGGVAMRFLNACLSKSECVAFILPRSFEKESMLRRVRPLSAHLLHSEILPLQSFERLGVPKSVPTVFMIWRHCSDQPPRNYISLQAPSDFEFLASPSEEDVMSGNVFMIQRVGMKAGKLTKVVSEMQSKRRSKNFYFVRSDDVETVWSRFSRINFVDRECKHKTAGMPSIAKSEIVAEYLKILNENK